jgi:hypothetical protein
MSTPCARAAVTQPISQGTIGASGVIFARVSLARSLVPITKAVSPGLDIPRRGCDLLALSMASGVSIIAQMRIFWSALMSTRRSATSSRWLGPDTFGTSTGVRLRLGCGVEIVEPPFGIEAIDANDDFARTEPAGGDGVRHLLPGRGLAVGSH